MKITSIKYVLLGLKSYLDTWLSLLVGVFLNKKSKMTPVRLQDARQILVVKLDHKLGDMVLFSVFVRELRKINPKATIHMVAHPSAEALYKNCHYIDTIHYFDWGKSLSLSLLCRVLRTFLFARNNLRDSYDYALVPRWDYDYHAAFLSFFSGATERIAYTEKATRHKSKVQFANDRLYTRTLTGIGVEHEVLRNLNFLASIAAIDVPCDSRLEYWPSIKDCEVADAFILTNELKEFIVIAPGAFEKKRMWPAARFAKLGCTLAQHFGCSVLIVGSKSEHDLCQKVADSIGKDAINIAGIFSINAIACLIAKARIYIGNDSGLMHLAAATNVPVVEISCHPEAGDPAHANSPDLFGPWCLSRIVIQPKNNVGGCENFCSHAHAHCILNIEVANVVGLILSENNWQENENECR